MPLDRNDEDRLMRAMARMLDERVGPARKPAPPQSSRRGLVEDEPIAPEVMKQFSESKHEFGENLNGMQRWLQTEFKQVREDVREEVREEIAKSIRPVAVAAQGTEAASVAGAQAMVRTEGKTEAVQVAANRADENSTVARVRSSQTLLILIGGIILQAAYNAWQHVAHMVAP